MSMQYKTATLTEANDDPTGGMLASTDMRSDWQRKSPEFDLDTDPDGTAWAIVAVTGVRDDVGDVIVPGAFRRTLRDREMKGVLGHDWNRPVAVQRKAIELLPGDPRLPDTLADGTTTWPREAGALLVKAAYILGTGDGRDAWVQAQAYGASQAYSIGYKVVDGAAKHKNGTRYIHDLDVYEFSPVLHGANRLATLQAIKSDDPDELEFTDGAHGDIEGKARGIRRVQDAAYWGRPVGTPITPGMKPAGPRARAGARDRGPSTRRTEGGRQAGVTGGMGAAGTGGIHRDTAAAVRARNARQKTPEDRRNNRVSVDSHPILHGFRSTGLDNYGPEDRHVYNDDYEPVRLADVDTASLQRADRDLDDALDREERYRRPEDVSARAEIRAELRRRLADEGVNVAEGESPAQARAQRRSTGDHQAARAAMTATTQRLAEEGYSAENQRRIRNLQVINRDDRALITDRSGRFAAADQGSDAKDRDLGWAVIDTRTGKLVAKGEDDDDVQEFVDAAAEAAEAREAREARDEQTGDDGGRALGDASARRAGEDSGAGQAGALPGAGGRSAGGGRDAGREPGRAGPDGGAVPGEGGPAAGGAGSGRGAGDSGDDPARARDAGAVDAGRGDAGPGAGGDAGGAGVRGGDRELLQRDGQPDRDAGQGAGSDAVTDPETDAGLPAEGVTADDMPAADLQTAQRIGDVPSDGDPFRPDGQEDLAPAGAKAKLAANMAAVRTLRALQEEDPQRNATPDEQAVLARWSGWGSLPKVFDDLDPTYADERAELRGLLSADEWVAARKNTLNAHYTDGRVTRAIWDALGSMGFNEAGPDGRDSRRRVLEPGSGSGNFIGMAPENTDMVGVELESTTAAISKYLYPNATIRNEGFEKTKLPDGGFDAVVGNVPYGKYKLHDPSDNPNGKLSVHNHFIMKSLRATRPGGVVAVLTSRYTLDSQDAKAREEMAKLGDLVGAVRLPNGSHQKAAGTDVIEDILVFRRRGEGEEPGDQSWVNSSTRDLGADEDLAVNDYFTQNPGHVLGELTARSGRFGPEVSVQGDKDMPGLADALADIASRANSQGKGYRPRDWDDGTLPALLEPDTSRYEGHVRREPDGTFTQARNGGALPLELPTSTTTRNGKTSTRVLVDVDEMEALLGLRTTLSDLLAEEGREPNETKRMRELRAQLNDQYSRYVDTYGPVTRYGYTAAGTRQNPPTPRFMATDPQFAIVRALETDFTPGPDGNQKNGATVTKASIFAERSASPRQLATTADTPEDALSLSMDTYGKVDLDAIAEMLGVEKSEARRRLGNLVHEVPPLEAEEEEALVARAKLRAAGGLDLTEDVLADPVADSGLEALGEYRGELVPAAEYLSGNVRRKLKIAREAALTDPRFERNVAELEAVIPADLGPDEIDAQLGAVWIPPSDVAQFAAELLGTSTDNVAVTHLGGSWTIKSKATKSFRATQEWGTKSRNTIDLIEAILNKKEISVTSKDLETGKSVKNMDATLAAQEKADEISERFQSWIWENTDRARRLATQYNDQFNGIALRSYDRAHREYPGMSKAWKPRPHQVAAVERIISEPTALLGHVVGAGKTAEMAMGAAELKRLGMAKKPAIVVPNHMLEQFTREYLEVYPNAKVLAAGTDDLSGDKRREFIARAAVGDWDVVILTQNGFQSIPMSKEEMTNYVAAQTAEMRTQLEQARGLARAASSEGGQSGRTKRDAADKSIKDMETSIANMTAKLEELVEKGSDDTTLTFESTGIDYVMVDEAHQYSNLRTPSRMQGAGAQGAGKATDLHMKLEYLRRTTQSGRVATFATGTPIRNSVTQAYIMMKYLRPDLLQEAGINSFDDWANTFGETVTEMELKPEGNGFRQNTRFSKFKNVPELLRIYHTFADIKLAEDLKLPRPNLVGGKAENVVVPGSDALRDYIRDLGDRAEQVRAGTVDPTEDNMLKISMDGRKAALSMSLVTDPETGEQYEHETGKIEAAADNIAGIHDQHKDTLYPINPKKPELGMHPDPGGLQVVFMDMGTPKSAADRKKAEKDGIPYFDGYEKLREELVARGMNRDRIRFMHEARNDREKAELFAAARSGKIDVLVGSTEKMGVGTNVQARATALHHLDAPWRPSDVEQRDGRVLRQGNGNPEVRILRYVTEDSFDAYMWQTLERKAKFINQIQKGSLDVREIEDVGDTAMSYAEIKALATGNPDLLDKAKVDALHHKLSRLERNYNRQQTNMRSDIGRLETAIETGTDFAQQFDEALAQRTDITGDKFSMAVGGQQFAKRADAATALHAAMVDRRPSRYDREITYGTVGGFDVKLAHYYDTKGYSRFAVRLHGVPGDVYTFETEELTRQNPAGMLTRIENYLNSLERRRATLATQLAQYRTDLDGIRGKIGVPFPQAALLSASGAKAARLQAKMELDARRKESSLTDADVLELPDDHPLAFRPDIDTDENDDPLVRTPDTPVTEAPTDDDVARAEGLTTGPADAREVTSPAGEVDAGTAEEPAPVRSAAALDAAHGDTMASLGEGDHAGAAAALERMGVPEGESAALADRLMVVPEREQSRLLDSVERLHSDDPNGTDIRQQARSLVRGDDDSEEISADELAEAAGDPPEPEGMSAARRAELVQYAEDYAGQYGGPDSPTPGVDNATRYIMEGHASPNAAIDPAERDWLRDYIAGRPYLLDQAPPTATQLAERTRQRADTVRTHLNDAQASAQAGDLDEAERQITAAEQVAPSDVRIGRARQRLTQMRADQAETAPAGEPQTVASASSGPAAPPRVEELHTATIASLGIRDDDQVAISDGSVDADGEPIVMVGTVFGLDGRFIYLRTPAGGDSIRVGPRDREYQIAKLDADGRVVPVRDPAAPTQGGTTDAGLPVRVQPTPETTRARTNRVGAAAKIGGGDSGGGRRVKDGSVHTVSAPDDPDAVRKVVDQVEKLGWAGAVTRVGEPYEFLGERRRRIELQVPDTGPDGRPLRTFDAAPRRAGQPDPATPGADTPEGPQTSPTIAREVGDRFRRGGTVQDALDYTPGQLRAGADDLTARGGSGNARRADALRNMADTVEQQQRTGRDVDLDPATGAPVPEPTPEQATITADELAAIDAETTTVPATGRVPDPVPSPPAEWDDTFPEPDLNPGDYGRRSINNLIGRYTTERRDIRGDARERDRLIRALTDGQLRILEGAAIVEARENDPDGNSPNTADRARRVILAATQDEIGHRLAGNRRTRRVAAPTSEEDRFAGKARVAAVNAAEPRRTALLALDDALSGTPADEIAAYYTDDEARELIADGTLAQMLGKMSKPEHAAARDRLQGALDLMQARARRDDGDEGGAGEPDDVIAPDALVDAGIASPEPAPLTPTEPDRPDTGRGDAGPSPLPPAEAAAPDVDEIDSADPSRHPRAHIVRMSASAADTMRIRINDVLTGDHAEDDGLGGYVDNVGRLRVHDKAAMLATIDNELDILESNLRGPGSASTDPTMRNRWRGQERAMVSLRRQVAELPDTRPWVQPEPVPEPVPEPAREPVMPRGRAGRGARYIDPDEADDQAARDMMNAGRVTRAERENAREGMLEVARELGPNPTADQLAEVEGYGWDGGQHFQLNQARRELGYDPVLTERESVGTRARPGATVPIRDEVAGTRSGPARNRILAELSDEDLRAVAEREQWENEIRGNGRRRGDWDRRKQSAYQKRQRIIRDIEAEEQRRRDTGTPATDDTGDGTGMTTLSPEELAAAELPERDTTGGIGGIDDGDELPAAPEPAAATGDVDADAIVAQIHGGGNGGDWNALLEPLTADQRRPILERLEFDALDAMSEYAFMSEDKGWRDQLIQAIRGINPRVGDSMRAAALAQDRRRARTGEALVTGPAAILQALGNPADRDFAANMVGGGVPAAEIAESRARMARSAFGDDADMQIRVEADRLDDMADRIDAGDTANYGVPYDSWAAKLRDVATALRTEGATERPERATGESTAPQPTPAGAPTGDTTFDPAVDGPAPADDGLPASASGDGEVILNRIDGPQAAILARRLPPQGGPARLASDRRMLSVTDPDGFETWLGDEIARIDRGEGGQGRSQDRKDRRALVRLQVSLEEARDGDDTDTADAPGPPRADTPEPAVAEPAEDTEEGPELELDADAFTDTDTGTEDTGTEDTGTEDTGTEDTGTSGLPPIDDLGVDPAEFDDDTEPDTEPPEAEAPEAETAPPGTPGEAPEPADDTLPADDITDALADANAAEADALGLIEADDGELEVTEEVAARQTRVADQLAKAERGELDVTRQKDSELSENRRDIVDELRLQEAVQRRENQRRREQRATQRATPTPEPATPAPADDGGEGATPTPAPEATPEPTNNLAGPTRRPGLAGSVEDLADAIDAGDQGAIDAATRRARSSLARSRADSGAHTELGQLIDSLAAGEDVDPDALRALATQLRDAAKARRNERARARRLVKRLERERLRSLLGSYDAELRNRGRNPDDYGGPAPSPTPDDGPDSDGGPGGGAPPAGMSEPAPESGGDTGTAEAGTDAAAGAGQGTATESAVPVTFDRSDPDGPTGQGRTTELVDGLTAEPWRLLGNADTLFPSSVTPEQRQKMETAARAAFGPLLDTYGPMVRRQNNERIEQARISAMTRRRRMRTGRATDPAAMTFMEALTGSGPAGQAAFMRAFQDAAADYKRRVSG